VLVDREAGSNGFSSVSVDDVAGGHLAAAHLIGTGRRRLAFVGGQFSMRQVADRLAGARRAVFESNGVTLEHIPTDFMNVSNGRIAGEALRLRRKSERPDAVFAGNDLIALGVLQGLMGHNDVRVPEEIAIIGYDDIEFASAAVIPLSSIRQPSELIGQTGVDLLLRPGENLDFEHVVFQPELVVRASTAG